MLSARSECLIYILICHCVPAKKEVCHDCVILSKNTVLNCMNWSWRLCLAFILKVVRYPSADPKVVGGNVFSICSTHQFISPGVFRTSYSTCLIAMNRWKNHLKATGTNYDHHLSVDMGCDFVLDNNAWLFKCNCRTSHCQLMLSHFCMSLKRDATPENLGQI